VKPRWEYADFPVIDGIATTPRGQIRSSAKVVRVLVLMEPMDASDLDFPETVSEHEPWVQLDADGAPYMGCDCG
jgi:hypothetical protein